MQDFVAAQHGHVVNILPPVDLNGGVVNSDVFSMKGYSHASIIIQVGVSAGAAPTVKLQACDNFVPSNPTDMAFTYYAETTALGDTLAAKASATSSGLALSQNNNIYYVIEVDARELADGFPALRLTFSDPAASFIASAVAVLSGSRYAGDPATHGTAIA